MRRSSWFPNGNFILKTRIFSKTKIATKGDSPNEPTRNMLFQAWTVSLCGYFRFAEDAGF
jgi:hypothetical protein